MPPLHSQMPRVSLGHSMPSSSTVVDTFLGQLVSASQQQKAHIDPLDVNEAAIKDLSDAISCVRRSVTRERLVFCAL